MLHGHGVQSGMDLPILATVPAGSDQIDFRRSRDDRSRGNRRRCRSSEYKER